MSPTNAKLGFVRAQISDHMDNIQALKAQITQTEMELQRLRDEEAAILEMSADHRRALSPFRNLTQDVIREIFTACLEDEIPGLNYSGALPYVLSRISSGTRHTALTTPSIWSSFHIDISCYSGRLEIRRYEMLARRARQWLQRSGGLALTISIADWVSTYVDEGQDREYDESDLSNALFDTLFSYSSRWKAIRIRFSTNSNQFIRFTALKAADVPCLQSITISARAFGISNILTIPTLRQLTLETGWNIVPSLTVNWAVLTDLTLHGSQWNVCCSIDEIAEILQQTKFLVFCDLAVGPSEGANLYPREVNLPLLQELSIDERAQYQSTAGASSILDLIKAPMLRALQMRARYIKRSLSAFLEQSPTIRIVSLPLLNDNKPLSDITESLRHCLSLTTLFLQPWDCDTGRGISDGNALLRSFVQDGGDGVVCPRLEYFTLGGNINFSLETMREFLGKGQGEVAALNGLFPWKGVLIDMRGIPDAEIYQQMKNLVSQNQEAGLNVHAIWKEEASSLAI